MGYIEFCRALTENGYSGRNTLVKGVVAFEWDRYDKRIIVVSNGVNPYADDSFVWYINNLVNSYGYDNVLYVDFTKNAGHNEGKLLNVNYWQYDITTNNILVRNGSNSDFYGVGQYFFVTPNKDEYRTKDTSENNYIHEDKKVIKYNRIFYINNILIAVNIIVFIILESLGDTDNAVFLYTHGGVSPHTVIQGNEYYRYITSMFVHSGLSHIFNNMLLLFFIGDNLERAMGQVKYIILYFGSGLIAGIGSQVYYYLCGNNYVVCVGASGAIFGVLGALVWVLIVNKGRLEDLSLGRMIIYLILSIGMGFNSPGISQAAHIAGLIGGFLLAMILYRRRGTCYEN